MRSIGVLVNERRLKAAYGRLLPQGEKEEKHAVWRDRWLSGSGGLFRRPSEHLPDPVVRVRRAAILDVDQFFAQPHRDRAGGAAVDDEIAARRTHLADRRDHRR